MSSSFHSHLRSNVVGHAAVLLMLVATVGAIAAVPAPATVRGHNARIVFERLVGPSFTSQIATVDPGGRDIRRLTHFNAGAVEPAWSPAGGRIVFAHLYKDGRPGALFSMRAGGEHRKRLSHGCNGQCLEDYEPSWSPDGSQIIFSRAFGPIVNDNASEIDLMVMRRSGKNIRTIKRFKLNGRNLEPHSASWSPDGERVALMLLDPESPTKKSAIFTLELDTADLERVTPLPRGEGGRGAGRGCRASKAAVEAQGEGQEEPKRGREGDRHGPSHLHAARWHPEHREQEDQTAQADATEPIANGTPTAEP